MFEALAVFYLVVLPLFYIGGPNGIREFLSIAATMAAWVALAGHSILGGSLPYLALPVCVFAGWSALSVLWSNSKDNSIFDWLMIASCITAFYVIQQIDREFALLICFAPAPAISVTMLREEVLLSRGKTTGHPGGLFGNSNHAGAYLAINVLIGVWLATEISFYLAPFVLLTILAVFSSRSRGAQVSVLAGVASVFLFMGQWWILTLAPVVMAYIICRMVKLNRRYAGRDIIFRKAWDLIKDRPLFGWGLNSFRFEHGYRNPGCQSHRVHNDFLEFWNDLGLVGLGVLAWIYASADWTFSPFLSAQLIVGLLTACLFFTFREIHTAMPVWCLLAVLIPTSQAVSPSMAFAVMALAVLPYIFWIHVGKKILGLYWYAKGSYQRTPEAQYKHCLKALHYDPNTIYMARTAYLATQNRDPHKAWDLCCQALYKFDGMTVLYTLYDQTSRAALQLGGVEIADYFNKQSLKLNPKFGNSLKFSEVIADLKAQFVAGGAKCVGGV